MLRKANVAAPTGDTASADLAVPRRRDVLEDDEGCLWLRLRFTKTIQFGERVLWISLHGIADSVLDPVAKVAAAHPPQPRLTG
jgi:hypothetical protein